MRWPRIAAVRAVLAVFLTVCVAACGSFTYEGTPPGKIRGQLLVIWVGEDRFVYWPFTNDPLTFALGPDLQQKLGFQTIRPGLMYTDGGSIPRPCELSKDFPLGDMLLLIFCMIGHFMLTTVSFRERRTQMIWLSMTR